MRITSKNKHGSKEVYVKYRSRNKNKIYSLSTKSLSNCCKKRVNKFNFTNNSTIYSKTFYSSQSTEVFPVRINVSRFFNCIKHDIQDEEFSEVEQRVINYSEYKISSDKGVNSFLKIPVSWSYNMHNKLSKENRLTKEQFWQVKECIELVQKIKDSKCFTKGTEGSCKIEKILSLVCNRNALEKNRIQVITECAELAEIIKEFFEKNGFPMNTLYSLLQNNISTKYKIEQIDEPPETVKGVNEDDSLTQKQLKQIVKYTELVHRVKSFKTGQQEIVNSRIIKDKYKILEKSKVNDVQLTKQYEEVREISNKDNTKKSDAGLKTKDYLQVGKLIKGISDYFNIFKICTKAKGTRKQSKEKPHESFDIQAIFNNHNSKIDVNKENKEQDGEKRDMTKKFKEEKPETVQNIQNCFRVEILLPKLATKCLDKKFSHKEVSKQLIIPPVKDVKTQLITPSEKEVTVERSKAIDRCECYCRKCNKMRKINESSVLPSIFKYCQRNPGNNRRPDNWYPLPPKYIPTHPTRLHRVPIDSGKKPVKKLL